MSICNVDVTANRTGPTNAGVIENNFVDAVKQRFRKLRGLIRRTVGYQNDAFQLTENADEREAFDFPTSTGKIESFIRWLRQAIRDEILEPINPIQIEEGQHWTAVYIRESFIQGVNQSTGLLFQQGVSVDNPPNEDITRRPIFQNTLRKLYTRTYENLKSISEDMAPEVRQIVTQGFAEGWNPRKMADEINDEIRDIQHTRAETLARSETINAHSSASLDNYERAGVDVVNHGDWSAADDTRTCPFCRRLDGTALKLSEVRGAAVEWRGQIYRLQPPAHPNGRCVVMPSVGSDRLTSTLHERLDKSFEAFTILSGG